MTVHDETWEEIKPVITLRPYQIECLAAIRTGWENFSRTLAVLATGCGKTVIFAHVAKQEVDRGGKVLIIAHTDELLEQAIDKIFRATGIVAEKEKADCRASPFATVVVASIQSLSRTNRLLGFSPDHFSLVICDETHRALANSYQKVMRYFHFGAESLAEDWKMPEPDMPYKHHARCLGVTATADRGDKRSLGEFYQTCVFDYGLLAAVRDGWLVRPVIRNIPLKKVDMRGIGKKGGDYDAGQVVARITPFLRDIGEKLTEAMKEEGWFNRKLVVFTPSVETADLLAQILRECGVDADFVSGACHDREEKIADFDKKPNGAAIACAMLLIEGWDCHSVNAICVLRHTKIRSLYAQAAGRGFRPIPGTVDGLATAEDRLQAIADSEKHDCLMIDFLFHCDTMDLIEAVDLVATSPAQKEAIKATGILDLEQAAELGNRDLLASLQKAAAKHARKEARTVDPLAMAVSLFGESLKNYAPETQSDAEPMTPGQKDFLVRQKIDTTHITCKGMASKLIGRFVSRLKHGLATPGQLSFMLQLGVDRDTASKMTIREAGATIDRVLAIKSAGRSISVQSAPPSPAIPLGIEEEVC